ncbi:exocyst complex component Sec10-domain-containing protein [Jimgerdemannia flammicorona]|uniref:Exocyst complex component Sec10-domain-containing protein n=1 Tax=Jimgerdemannia flammicorona TaxID=994334 RepID=A0A433D6I5_9FUNG|nr:exocyst complex component Sec10-domain-containing protein [Jimgerdemannia flammicorona]
MELTCPLYAAMQPVCRFHQKSSLGCHKGAGREESGGVLDGDWECVPRVSRHFGMLMMLDHFRKFYVSASGGLLLSKDIAKYQETIQIFKLPSLNDRFEMLRQLGNVFLVRPEMIKIIISEGYLARLDHRALAPYLQMRTDYKSAKIDQLVGVLEGGIEGDGDESSPGGGRNIRKGHKRLSAFMRDNSVMRDLMERYSSNKEFLLHGK